MAETSFDIDFNIVRIYINKALEAGTRGKGKCESCKI
jgi:hypothetical protein